MISFRIFAVILLLQLGTAQVVRKGKCPNVHPQPNFNERRFMGLWYRNEQYFYDVDFTYKCAAFSFYPKGDGSGNILEDINGIDVNSGKWVNRIRTLIRLPNQPGIFVIQSLPGHTAEEFDVVETDYNNYAVAYFCKQSGKYLAEAAFILTRKPHPLPKDLRKRIYSKLAQSGIDPGKLITHDHSNCPAFRPVPFSNTYRYQNNVYNDLKYIY